MGRYLDGPVALSCANLLATRHAALLPLACTPYYLLLMVEIYAVEHDLPANRAVCSRVGCSVSLHARRIGTMLICCPRPHSTWR